MKLCICKNISVEEFKKVILNKSFDDAVSELKLGSMCKTCIHQARQIYNKEKINS